MDPIFYAPRRRAPSRYIRDDDNSIRSGSSRGDLNSLRYNNNNDNSQYSQSNRSTRIKNFNIDNGSSYTSGGNRRIAKKILKMMRETYDDSIEGFKDAGRDETHEYITAEDRTYIILDKVHGVSWTRSFKACRRLSEFKGVEFTLGTYYNMREDINQDAIIMVDYYKDKMKVKVRTQKQVIVAIGLSIILLILIVFYRRIHNSILSIT